MKCPIDETELQMNERQGVEIDYCPKCRGIWLDRGELDKLIERSEQYVGSMPEVSSQAQVPYQQMPSQAQVPYQQIPPP